MVDKLSVLRECNRVLKPGGRMAGYLIHTPAPPNSAAAARAHELGPSNTAGPATPAELALQAGFTVLAYQDETAAFRDTCVAFLDARRALETELRAEEGDAFYAEELAKKETMLMGIDKGLLQRALIVTMKD